MPSIAGDVDEDREFDRGFPDTHRHILHVLVLVHVLVIDEDVRVALVPVAAIVMDVELLVVTTVIATRAAPRRERPDVRLRPRVARVVESDCRHAGAVEVVRAEGVAVVSKVSDRRALES